MPENEPNEIAPVDLSSLAGEHAAARGLEDKVADALIAKGLIRPRGRNTRALWWQAIAATVLLVLGFAVGRVWHPVVPKPQTTFVLLLREQGNWRPATTADEERRRVDEYRAWARQLRGEGRIVDGLELLPGARALGDGSVSDTGIAGFFTFSARTLDEALAVARTCPHLRYGGQVEVREGAG